MRNKHSTPLHSQVPVKVFFFFLVCVCNKAACNLNTDVRRKRFEFRCLRLFCVWLRELNKPTDGIQIWAWNTFQVKAGRGGNQWASVGSRLSGLNKQDRLEAYEKTWQRRRSWKLKQCQRKCQRRRKMVVVGVEQVWGGGQAGACEAEGEVKISWLEVWGCHEKLL